MYQLTEREARATLTHMVEPGDTLIGAWLGILGARSFLEALDAGELPLEVEQRVKRIHLSHPIREIIERAAASGVTFITPADWADWPQQLNDLGASAPIGLWVRGTMPGQGAKLASIVGARAATSYGENIALSMAGELCQRPIGVVSGAAYGIDGAAHRGALAVGGKTYAFLAGGADRAYPAGHAELLSRIAASGAVISEVPPGTAPTKWRFLARNRLIAAMSPVSVVVEAGVRSGSLNEAGHAQSLGRIVAAVPGPVTSAASGGTNLLIRNGAKLVTSADDVAALIP